MINLKWGSVIGGLVFAVAPMMVMAADTGTIEGVVKLDGKAPPAKPIDTSGDANCAKMHGDQKLTEQKLVVSKDGGVQWAFVKIAKGLPDKKWEAPKEPVVLDQKGCHYEPHVFGIVVGQPLEVRNSDDTSHNIHGLPKENKEFNFGQPTKGMTKTIELTKPESFAIKCDVHKWMNAHAHVVEHPFFAVTDADGKFTIKNVPPGDYELEFWHETLGKQTKKVTVKAGETAKVGDVAMKLSTGGRPRPARK